MNEKIKYILSVYAPRLQWLIYDLKTYSLDEDPITLHLTGGDVTISLNPKNKTTMNRQQAKNLLPIIQAFAEGKQIEKRDLGSFSSGWKETKLPAFNPAVFEYRIKSEPKYRPFANAEECWQEMQKHQPFGWVKASHGQFLITGLRKDGVAFGINDNWQDYNYMFKSYTFADGTPFGIKEE